MRDCSHQKRRRDLFGEVSAMYLLSPSPTTVPKVNNSQIGEESGLKVEESLAYDLCSCSCSSQEGGPRDPSGFRSRPARLTQLARSPTLSPSFLLLLLLSSYLGRTRLQGCLSVSLFLSPFTIHSCETSFSFCLLSLLFSPLLL